MQKYCQIQCVLRIVLSYSRIFKKKKRSAFSTTIKRITKAREMAQNLRKLFGFAEDQF